MKVDTVLLAVAAVFAAWMAYKVIKHYFFTKPPRKLWAGSLPITDPALRAWYETTWWETYEKIDPADRVHHTPTPHWWLYLDHETFLPQYLGQNLIGWWAKEQRAIFFTKNSKRNVQLVRHECAHDIMDSITHSDKYFTPGKVALKQFQ